VKESEASRMTIKIGGERKSKTGLPPLFPNGRIEIPRLSPEAERKKIDFPALNLK